MSKSYKPKDGNYIDSAGVSHNHTSLKEILDNLYGFKAQYYSSGSYSMNDFNESGIYSFDTSVSTTDRPTRSYNTLDHLIVLRGAFASLNMQFWFNGEYAMYFRVKKWGTWSNWKKISIS